MATARKTSKSTTKKAAKISAKRPEPASEEKPKVYFAPAGPKANSAPTFPVVNAKCRRGGDQQTAGQSCKSLTAENMSPAGSHVVQFRCTLCKYVWRVQTGGAFQGV